MVNKPSEGRLLTEDETGDAKADAVVSWVEKNKSYLPPRDIAGFILSEESK